MNLLRRIAMRLLPICSIALVSAGHAAQDGGRHALVIGNGAYESIGSLPNPTADAQLMATTLEDLGFETTVATDSDLFEMKHQIAEFGRTLRAADKSAIGFFFYAGHGVQAGGRNYLLPIEASPADEADLDLMGVEANWVLRQMESAGNRSNVIVLDACRNNPFVARNRSLSRGLAQIDAPTGSFISYATAPGKTALDGDSINSPFTRALARALPQNGLALEQVFKKVRVDVIRATDGAQTPWDSSSLVDDIVLNPLADPVESRPAPVRADAGEALLWESTLADGEVDAIALFLQAYPDGAFAARARSMLIDALMSDNESRDDAAAAPTVDELATPSVPSAPDEAEIALIGEAQSSGSAELYRRYVESYPEGTFADLARAELDALQLALADTSSAPRETVAPAQGVAIAPEPAVPSDSIAVDDGAAEPDFRTATISIGSNAPRSIEELSRGSPAFAPFEGLDEALWKEQSCSNCHEWNAETLCTQASFYVSADETALTRIEHPYGGPFKRSLKRWSEIGCPE